MKASLHYEPLFSVVYIIKYNAFIFLYIIMLLLFISSHVVLFGIHGLEVQCVSTYRALLSCTDQIMASYLGNNSSLSSWEGKACLMGGPVLMSE